MEGRTFQLCLVVTCLVIRAPTVWTISTTSTTDATTTELTTTVPCSYAYQYDIRVTLESSNFVDTLADPTSPRYLQLKEDLVNFNLIAFAGEVSCDVQTSQYVFTGTNQINVKYLLELNEPLPDDQVRLIITLGPDMVGEGTVDISSILVNPTFVSTSTEAPTTTPAPYDINLYPFGPDSGDTDLTCGSPLCFSSEKKIRLLRIEDIDFRRLIIATNGYVKLGAANFPKRQPTPWDEMFDYPSSREIAASQGLGMVAALWTDSDITLSTDTKVYYQIYDKASRYEMSAAELARWEIVANRTRSDAINYGGTATFDPTWVLVVTWVNMLPRVHYDTTRDTGNTYQLIVMNDGLYLRSYAEILFKETGWDSSWNIRNSMIGHFSENATQTKQLTASYSNTGNAFKLDSLSGNSGEIGKWITVLNSGSESVSYEEKCLDWYTEEKHSDAEVIAQLYSASRSCPCDGATAALDCRWRLDLTKADLNQYCYYESSPYNQSTQECCYDDNGQGALLTGQGEGGNFFKYHPNYDVSHLEQDVTPKSWCCTLSTTYCDLFYELRPIDSCENYQPQTVAWSYGDPHITTIDGMEYTYNGLGEFYMLTTPEAVFTVLGRTARVLDLFGDPTDATVFSAFAAKEAASDPVHVERSDDSTALLIYVNNIDVTSWFSAAPIGDVYSGDNVAVIKVAATSASMSFATTGFSVTAVLGSGGILDSMVFTPVDYFGKTSGLLGVYNNDVSDDLTTSAGLVLDPTTTTESEIYYQFGESWRVTSQAGNFLYYTPGTSFSTYSNPTFVPLFTADLLARVTPLNKARIEAVCAGATQCIFDAMVTNDDTVGVQTKTFNDKTVLEKSVLDNRSPLLTGSAVWNVTADATNTYTMSISDPDGDTTVLYLANSLPEGAQFDNTTGVVTWFPSTSPTYSLEFMAYDTLGGQAAKLAVTIAYCNCSQHGVCPFDRYINDVGKGAFRQVECLCDTGWEGDSCELDQDACTTNPCQTAAFCSDLTPTQEVATGASFTCSECDPGFFLDPSGEEYECVDINECLIVPPICEQTCTNTHGSYLCECGTGYSMQTNGSCADIDECSAGSSDCQQQCENSVGGFVCSCFPGYELASDSSTCNDVSGACSLNCSNGCKPNKTDECFCPNGFILGSDNQTCDDINECASPSLNTCDYPHVCVNEFGGFRCVCEVGYILQADRLTCKACPSGKWGAACQEVCNCGDSSTSCNITYGCESCFEGWTGGSCRDDIDECLASPCQGDHVTCVNTQGSYRCDCDAGFQTFNVTTCIEIDECEGRPCLNNGQCIDMLSGYTCSCDTAYTGSRCETDLNECVSNPCQNGGTCVDRPGKFRCLCTDQWMGNTCEVPVPVPTTVTAVATTTPVTTGVAVPTTTELSTAPPLCDHVVVYNSSRVFTYSGRFRIQDRGFQSILTDEFSLEFKQLSAEVFPQLVKVYGCAEIIKGLFISITNLRFKQPGTIMVLFDVNLNLKVNYTKLENILNEAYALRQLTFNLVPAETDFSLFIPPEIVVDGDLTGLPMWVTIMFVVAGIVGLIILVLLILWLCKKPPSRRLDDSSDSSSSSSSDYSGFRPYTFPKPSPLFWQDSDSVRRMPPALENYGRGRDEERLRVIRSAFDRAPQLPVVWPRARQYHHSSRHRRSPRQRQRSVWSRPVWRSQRRYEGEPWEVDRRRSIDQRLHRNPVTYRPADLSCNIGEGLFHWSPGPAPSLAGMARLQPVAQPAVRPMAPPLAQAQANTMPGRFTVTAPRYGAFSYTGGAFEPERMRPRTVSPSMSGEWMSVGMDIKDCCDS